MSSAKTLSVSMSKGGNGGPSIKRVIIVYPFVWRVDAVGNDIIEELNALQAVGAEVSLYAERYDAAIAKYVCQDPMEILRDKSAVLIYHHAGFWEKGLDLLQRSTCKKVIKYHNITPEHYFLPYSEEHYRLCLLGRWQNKQFLDMNIDMIMSDSSFNAQEFLNMNFPKHKSRVLAPFHRIHDFEGILAEVDALKRLSDGKINVFFIGRIAPNKAHKSILYTAYYYKLLFGSDIRFVIGGAVDEPLTRYYEELVKLMTQLKIQDVVEFTGRLSVQQLKSYYLGSHAFLLLSEHEGFCIPILESQFFKVPVIAYGSSAVPETIGENQLVFDRVDYETLASSIHTVFHDVQARQFLVEEGTKNFLKYEKEVLRAKFISYLEDLV